MNNTEELLAEIEQLRKENTKLNKAIKHTKFGLVWMDVPEAFDKESENKIPVLEEIRTHELVSLNEFEPNILIEGDNYHSLTCLNFTHKDAVDIIYIDPPYNTEKGDFRYKDKRIIDKYPNGQPVKKDDPIRHSKWLSFMSKRLKLAKNLLKKTGVIFISIDDNEQAHLKLLCDQIFDGNFIACLPTVMNLKGNNDQLGFAGTHEYTLVYAKDLTKVKLNGYEVDEESIEKEWQEDDIGLYKKADTLRRTGEDAPRERRPKGWFPVFITQDNHIYVTNDDMPLSENDYILYPINDNGDELSWSWGKNKIKNEPYNLIVTETKKGKNIYKKQRPAIGELPSRKPKSLFYKAEYSSSNGTAQLKKLFGKKVFNNPKPLDLIKDLLHIGGNKNATVLDFFAGSGTTGQAVLELNDQDNGARQFILCTNNEENICQEVTLERLRRLHAPEEHSLRIAPLPTNLKYYKTKFTGNHPNVIDDDDKVEIAYNVGELVALRENILFSTDKTAYGQFFKNKTGNRHLAIYFQEDYSDIEEFKEHITANTQGAKEVLIYVFSWGNENHSELFEDLKIKHKVKPIPQPILEIYKKIYRG